MYCGWAPSAALAVGTICRSAPGLFAWKKEIARRPHKPQGFQSKRRKQKALQWVQAAVPGRVRWHSHAGIPLVLHGYVLLCVAVHRSAASCDGCAPPCVVVAWLYTAVRGFAWLCTAVRGCVLLCVAVRCSAPLCDALPASLSHLGAAEHCKGWEAVVLAGKDKTLLK